MSSYLSIALRFARAFAIGFIAIATVQLLKGQSLVYAIAQASMWSALAATIFTATRTWKLRQGQQCAICGDVPGSLPYANGLQPDRQLRVDEAPVEAER